jgi:hypothetical protein
MNLYRLHEKTCIEVRRLSAAESAEIESWLSDVHRFKTDQQAFLIARANFLDLESEIFSVRSLVAEGRSLGSERLIAIRLQLNRRVANYLSSVRSYLDQTVHTLSERYGNPSAELTLFEQATNDEYGANADYRFTDQLRNYTQHYGFGLDHIRASSDRKPDGTAVGVIELCFERDALLSSGFRWKTKVRDDMTAGPPQIDVLTMTSGLNDSITRLGAKRIEIESPKMLESLRKLQLVISEVAADGPGLPALFEHNLGTGSGLINLIEFPMETIGRILAAIGAR